MLVSGSEVGSLVSSEVLTSFEREIWVGRQNRTTRRGTAFCFFLSFGSFKRVPFLGTSSLIESRGLVWLLMASILQRDVSPLETGRF